MFNCNPILWIYPDYQVLGHAYIEISKWIDVYQWNRILPKNPSKEAMGNFSANRTITFAHSFDNGWVRRNIGDDYTKNWSHHQIDMHLPMQHSGKKSIFRAINFREIKMKFLLKFIRLDYNPALISSKNYYLITFCWGENCFICGTEIGQTNNRLFKKKWIFFTLKTKQRV